MHAHTLLGAIGICAVVGTFLANGQASNDAAPKTEAAAASPAVTAPAAAQPRRDHGHLILQIEGNATTLSVTWITPKASAYNQTSVRSPFRVDLFDAAGRVLGSYPLDLRHFDMNPARVGQKVRTKGCEVRDTAVATILNVPFFKDAVSAKILHGQRLLGTLNNATYTKLVEAGAIR